MTRKKNKFLTFCFSLLPGAGEMYLGFMKQGISLMGIFFLVWALSGMLNLPALLFVQPVIWFYSFFHVHNLNSLPEEEFYSLEDDYLFHCRDFPLPEPELAGEKSADDRGRAHRPGRHHSLWNYLWIFSTRSWDFSASPTPYTSCSAASALSPSEGCLPSASSVWAST